MALKLPSTSHDKTEQNKQQQKQRDNIVKLLNNYGLFFALTQS